MESESWESLPTITVTETVITEDVEVIGTDETAGTGAGATALPPSVLSSRHIPGWKISGMWPRQIFHDKGQILAKTHRTYREQKPVKTNTKRSKKLVSEPKVTYQYDDPRFTPWQKELSKKIHEGNHVVVDVTTSCGKTWATNQIVTHETLSDDIATAIFVSPNPEIMRDNVADIRFHNYKYYLSGSKRMIDTQTRSYCTYDERSEPSCQIMCLTADNFVNFVTNELNHEFISKLKYLVFDEVHLEEVSATMWWSGFLPHTAQFVLLSATLGDVSKTMELVRKIAPHKPLCLIEYHIRPIPLQHVLFKGCTDPENGYRCSTLKAAKRMSCQVNPYDPTSRDIISIDRAVKIPEDRVAQYTIGQEVIGRTDMSLIESSIDKDLAEAVVDPTPHNLYNLLSYLFSNGMQPAMVFHTSAAAVQDLAKRLVAHISAVEEADPLFRKASKATAQLEKSEKRLRDKTAELEEKLTETGGKWNRGPSDDGGDTVDNSAELAEMASNLNRWKFPSQFGDIPTNIPVWIQDCLKYGIGVYLKSFPAWLRYKMFDAMKEGKLQVMIADKAVAVGINLPFRTTILCGDIDPTLFKQMGGRAGRWGLDNQGYIVSMFDKPKIRECYLTKTTPVTIEVPTEMSFTELVRLQTPIELSSFYTPTKDTDPKEPRPPGTMEVDGETLKQIILAKYVESVAANESLAAKVQSQLGTIVSSYWHYHRLTNLIQSLPYNETIIFMLLLVDGHLTGVDVDRFITIMAYLFQRKPASAGESAVVLDKPTAALIDSYARHFNINVDFSVPVSDYFVKFCKTGTYNVHDLDNIDRIGEWIYVFKRQAMSIAPKSSPFRETLCDVDERYVIGCKRAGLV